MTIEEGNVSERIRVKVTGLAHKCGRCGADVVPELRDGEPWLSYGPSPELERLTRERDALRRVGAEVVAAYRACREANSMSGFWTHLDDLAALLDGRAAPRPPSSPDPGERPEMVCTCGPGPCRPTCQACNAGKCPLSAPSPAAAPPPGDGTP